MSQQNEGWLTRLLTRINRAVSEDMSDYDPDAEYDTRVKLPEWQLARLKERLASADERVRLRTCHYVHDALITSRRNPNHTTHYFTKQQVRMIMADASPAVVSSPPRNGAIKPIALPEVTRAVLHLVESELM